MKKYLCLFTYLFVFFLISLVEIAFADELLLPVDKTDSSASLLCTNAPISVIVRDKNGQQVGNLVSKASQKLSSAINAKFKTGFLVVTTNKDTKCSLKPRKGKSRELVLARSGRFQGVQTKGLTYSVINLSNRLDYPKLKRSLNVDLRLKKSAIFGLKNLRFSESEPVVQNIQEQNIQAQNIPQQNIISTQTLSVVTSSTPLETSSALPSNIPSITSSLSGSPSESPTSRESPSPTLSSSQTLSSSPSTSSSISSSSSPTATASISATPSQATTSVPTVRPSSSIPNLNLPRNLSQEVQLTTSGEKSILDRQTRQLTSSATVSIKNISENKIIAPFI